ncbi:hypothetical protein [Kingella sp. (in: b-proteobacteria)]|uniref:hypothetical protein n=1 Tax=Kingella sp. (in: b-proteobacteria) TaxID=2020713 RepID=UPI0026DB71B9|nr:hypothetical protein [Kingella sp. (in: b-proteobacteria)]MDO4656847.1 hypothetical protein [Kingella sp. (in: b-proteobacteria)]
MQLGCARRSRQPENGLGLFSGCPFPQMQPENRLNTLPPHNTKKSPQHPPRKLLKSPPTQKAA